MTYKEEILQYIDQDNLIGNSPNPTPQSDGNPLLLCAISSIIDNSLEKASYANKRLINGVTKLESTEYPGIWNKKANSPDQVTHDDLIGLVCFSIMMGLNFHKKLYDYGMKHHWIMSNTGKPYWTAITKPGTWGFYKASCTDKPSFFALLFLAISIFISAIKKKDTSGKQLTWLQITVLKGKYKLIDFISKFWYSKNSVKAILADFHGKDHPFTRYYEE